MSKFRASVHYGDWEGSSAADDADHLGLIKFLENKKLMDGDTEFLVGLELWIGENHGGVVMPPSIRCLIIRRAGDFETVASQLASQHDPLDLREIDLELSLNEFLGLFKRFSVVLTRRGLNLTEREYDSDQ